MERIFSIPASELDSTGVPSEKIIGSAHYVLISDFSRECMDSAGMVRLAIQYRDTATLHRPVIALKFFSSTKRFIPHETSQDMSEIGKDCLVDISFDERSGKPVDFIFYDKNKGTIVYWGKRWTPKGLKQ